MLEASIVAIAIALALITVGIGIWLVSRAKKFNGIDSGLMEDRGWDGEPGPDLDGDGKGNDVHWQKWDLPLTLELSSNLPYEWGKSIEAAAEEINSLLGRRLFTKTIIATEHDETMVEVEDKRPPRRHIYVMGDEGTSSSKGHTDFFSWPDGRLYSARIQAPESLTDINSMYVVSRHELLHALGLDHDTDPKSVMYHKVQSHGQYLTDHDIALLKRIYGRTATK